MTESPDADPEHHPSRSTHDARLPSVVRLALPALVMLVLGLWGLKRHNAMGNDEVATRWVAGLPVRDMVHVLRHLDAVHGLYYLIIHVWMVVGRSPTAIRVPSVIAAVLAVMVVAALAQRITGSSTSGLAAGLIAACTASVTYYAQTARSYAMVYLVVAFATLVLVRVLDRERTEKATGWVALRPWTLYGALIVLGGYLNELSLLVLGAHLVTVLCARRGRLATLRWLGTSVVAVVIVGPLIEVSQQQSTVLDYLRRPDRQDVNVLFHTYFGGSTVVAVVVAVVALVGVTTRWPTSDAAVSPATVALPLLVIPAGVLGAYSELATPLYAERYVLFGEIGAAILAGAGLDWLVQRIPAPRRVAALLMPAIVVLACVAVFAGQLDSQRSERLPQSRLFNFGGPASDIGAHARPGDGVLFFNSFFRKTRLGYPQDFRRTTDFAMAESPERAGTFNGRNKPFLEIRTLMLEYPRIWVVGQSPSRLAAHDTGVRLQAHVLFAHFIMIRNNRFGRIHVTLWQRS